MVTRSYSFTEHSSAPPAKVWSLLDDGSTWSKWAGPLIQQSWWEREGTPEPGCVGAIRGLGHPRVGSREEITEREAPKHHAYTIISGAPVRNYHATVDLTPEGSGTRIDWRGSYEPMPSWAAPVIAFTLARVVSGLCSRLARAAEKT